jgi:hypothetical protein
MVKLEIGHYQWQKGGIKMAVEGYGEKALTAEGLHKTIKELQAALNAAIRGKKPGKEEAQAWADHVDGEINQALDLLALREQYPELKDAFVELKTLAERADENLFRYGTRMGLPEYFQ